MDQKRPSGAILLIAGVVLAVFGVLAVFSPAAAGTAVVKMIAVVLLGTGIVQVLQSLRAVKVALKIFSTALGLITAGLGLMVLLNPETGSGFLTVLLMIYFVVQGLWKISWSMRYRHTTAWIWLLLSGVLSLAFVYLLWRQWPLSGEWAIGILVGIDLLLTGIALIIVALAVRKVRRLGSLDTINL